MAKRIDPKCHIGEVHGVYTIVDVLDEKDKYGHWVYKCICNECGFEKHSHYGPISGAHKAMTCKHMRVNGEYIPYGYVWKNKRLSRIFCKMISRCYDKNDKSYKWYGEKGIGVCDEWRNNHELFERWAIDSGYDDTLTIDRRDSSKDYCPENCQWISQVENSRKAGKVNWIDVGGTVLTGHQWAEKLGIGINTINTALRKHGEEKTKELIVAMLKEPPSTKHRKSHQTWFDTYGIQI
jgi:hypothetical protein